MVALLVGAAAAFVVLVAEVEALGVAEDVVLLDELWFRATTRSARRTTPTTTAMTTRADERDPPSLTTGCAGMVLLASVFATGAVETLFGAGVVETVVTFLERAPIAGTGGITIRVAEGAAELFLATAFFAGAFFATTFLATAFFAGAFFAGAFFATAFFATAFLVTAFFATAFFAGAFFAGAFFAGAFFALFLAAVFFTATGVLLIGLNGAE